MRKISISGLIALAIGTSAPASDSPYQGCTPTEKAVIEEAEARAGDLGETLKRSIDLALNDASRVNRGGSTDRKLRRASRMIDCATSKLGHAVYRCTSSSIKKHIASTDWIFGKEIRINEPFLKQTAVTRGAVILHELTHKCGATDAAYFNDGAIPRDTAFLNWPMIADTYEYWAIEGFCIPGETCRALEQEP